MEAAVHLDSTNRSYRSDSLWLINCVWRIQTLFYPMTDIGPVLP